MKKIKMLALFKLLTIMAILFLYNNAMAQETMEDVVYLKNGSIIRGKVENDSLNKIIKIETIGRNVFIFQQDEIFKITREVIVTDGLILKNKGYTNITSLGGIITQTVSIQTINGYKFKSRLFTGLGLSMEEIGRGSLLSIFGDVRYDPFPGRNTPLIYVNGGYSFQLQENRNWNRDNYKQYGGFLSETGIGVKSYFNNKTAFSFSVGYTYRSSRYSYDDWQTGHNIQVTDLYGRYTLRLGFTFQ